MANYQPIAKTITAGSAASGVALNVDLSTTSWGLAFLYGSAIYSNTVLRSGTVGVWESTAPTTSTPSRQTFTTGSGSYGITCRPNVQKIIKFFTNGE